MAKLSFAWALLAKPAGRRDGIISDRPFGGSSHAIRDPG
jgi:hypothetical protein